MKKINLPTGVITSEIDITEEDINNIMPLLSRDLTREDFGSEVRYNNYLDLMKSLEDFTLDLDTDLVTEDSNEIVERFYNVREWSRFAKKHKMNIKSSPMAGAMSKSAKIYYADGENGGGYFYLYSKDNGEGSITITKQ